MSEMTAAVVRKCCINAFNFLRLLGVVKTNTDLAAQLDVSQAVVSSVLQESAAPNAHLSEKFILKFEKILLNPRGYTLSDFEDMNQILGNNSKKGVNSMLATKVTRLEGMQEAVLDKLDVVIKKLEDLERENEALRKRLRPKK